MEQIIQQPHQEKLAAGKKTSRRLIIIGMIVLFGILLLIIFKPFDKVDVQLNSKPGAAAIATIILLENEVKIHPTVSNLLNLSVAYIKNNKPSKAIIRLKEAMKISPDSKLVYNNLGVANIMLRNYDPAIENCQKAISLDNNFTLAKNNLKWAVDEKNKVLISLQVMEKTPQAKRDLNFYIESSIKYLYIGDYKDCIDICKKGLTKNPGNTALLNNTGTALMMQKKYESAISEFQKVLKKDADNQLAKNNINWAMDEKKSNP